jgi:hypothetical protein
MTRKYGGWFAGRQDPLVTRDVLAQAREEPDARVARAARLTLDEVQRAPELLLAANDAGPTDWRELARRGGYPSPAVQLDSGEARAAWFAGYTRTYLERDLQELSSIGGLLPHDGTETSWIVPGVLATPWWRVL